jgi:hypothetical protein
MAKQDQNDTPSNLSRISVEFREREIARNEYQDGDQYYAGHPNALSDGDEKGKGETNTIGSKTDIQTRQKLIAKNDYSLNNPYNISNA